ncbi:hypothetical protein JSY36_15635 [Bacillus sp. H-16]|uniref:hypothetical protein n=1 Tax=Alteribacter salitolerans TaxID=2912333 RepID=UPI0019651B27|nr:hypothetical protein [Alteribacter salitolerans]MBM7097165.1 hypothetical protein [Alteribacter salitolerans]
MVFTSTVALLFFVNPFFAFVIGFIACMSGKKAAGNPVVVFLCVFIMSILVMTTVQRMTMAPELYGYAAFNSFIGLAGFALGLVAKKTVHTED